MGLMHLWPNLELRRNPERASCCRLLPWAAWRWSSSCWEAPPLPPPSRVDLDGCYEGGRSALGGLHPNPGAPLGPPRQPEGLEVTDKEVSDGGKGCRSARHTGAGPGVWKWHISPRTNSGLRHCETNPVAERKNTKDHIS